MKMHSALALGAAVCLAAVPGGNAEPQVPKYIKNAEAQACSNGNMIDSADKCQQASVDLNLDLTTTEVQIQTTRNAASGCYVLKIPARRSGTGYAENQIWYNMDKYGKPAVDQYPVCGGLKSEYGAGKYHCHMAYCIESEHGSFSKEECYAAQQDGCRAPPTMFPTKFPTMPALLTRYPTPAPTQGYFNPCEGAHECSQLCAPNTGDNCVDFSAPGARSFDSKYDTASTGAVSDTTCVVLDGNNHYGASMPSTCRLVHKDSYGKVVKARGKAGTDFRSATFASDYTISLKDCKAACDMMNVDEASCHAIEYDSNENACQLITNVNVKAMSPCDQTAYTCSCRDGYSVDATDARKCVLSTQHFGPKLADGQPCGSPPGNTDTVSCPNPSGAAAYFCDYGYGKYGHCVPCKDVSDCLSDTRLNVAGETECHQTCQQKSQIEYAPTRPPSSPSVRAVSPPPAPVYSHSKKPTLTRLLHTHSDWSIFEHYLSIAPGGEYMLYKENTQCHHDELIITARQCQIAAEAMNLPVTTEKNGIKFEYVQVERVDTSPRGCYYRVDPKAGDGQLPVREIWFNTADYGAPTAHKRPICVRSLLSTLSNKATSIPYTIFAPTDEAFLQFFKENPEMKDRLNDNPEVLVQLLLEHIIDGPQILPYSSSTTMRLTSEARLCLTPECQSDTEINNVCGRATDSACPSNFYCNWDMAEYGHCRACLANCNAGTFGKALLDCQTNCQAEVRVTNTQICSATQKCAMHMSRVPYCDFDAHDTGHCRMCMDVGTNNCDSMSDLNAFGKAECHAACSHCFSNGNCEGIDVAGTATSVSIGGVHGISEADGRGGGGHSRGSALISGHAQSASYHGDKYSKGYSYHGDEYSGANSATNLVMHSEGAKYNKDEHNLAQGSMKDYSSTRMHQMKDYPHAPEGGAAASSKYSSNLEYGGNAATCTHSHPCSKEQFCDFQGESDGHCISCTLHVSCHGHGMTQAGEDACRTSCKHGFDSYDDDYKKDGKYLRHETRTENGKGYQYSHHSSPAKAKYLDDDDASGKKSAMGARCSSDAQCKGHTSSYSTGTDVKDDDDDRFKGEEKHAEKEVRKLYNGDGAFCNFDHDAYGHCVSCNHVTSCATMIYSKGASSCRNVCKGSDASGDDDIYNSKSKGAAQYSQAAPARTGEYSPPTAATYSAPSGQREYSYQASTGAKMAHPDGVHGDANPNADYPKSATSLAYQAKPRSEATSAYTSEDHNKEDHSDSSAYGKRSEEHNEEHHEEHHETNKMGEAKCGGRYKDCRENTFCDFTGNGDGYCKLCTVNCEELAGVAKGSCEHSCHRRPDRGYANKKNDYGESGKPPMTGKCDRNDKCTNGHFCDFKQGADGMCESCQLVKDCEKHGLNVDGASDCSSRCHSSGEGGEGATELLADGTKTFASNGDGFNRRLQTLEKTGCMGKTCGGGHFCNFITDERGECEKCADVTKCKHMGFTVSGKSACEAECEREGAGKLASEAAKATAHCTKAKACEFMEFCNFKHGAFGRCESCPTSAGEAFCKKGHLRMFGQSNCLTQCTNSVGALLSNTYGDDVGSRGQKVKISVGADDDDKTVDGGAIGAMRKIPVVATTKVTAMQTPANRYTSGSVKISSTPYTNGATTILSQSTCHGNTHSDMGLHGCIAMCTSTSSAKGHDKYHKDDDDAGARNVAKYTDDDDRASANVHGGYKEHVSMPRNDDDKSGYRRRLAYGEEQKTRAKGYGKGADDDDVGVRVQNTGDCSLHSQCGTGGFCDMIYDDSPIPTNNDLLGTRTKAALRSGYGAGRKLYGDTDAGHDVDTRGFTADGSHSAAYKSSGIRGASPAYRPHVANVVKRKGRCVTCASLANTNNAKGDDDYAASNHKEAKNDDDLLQTRSSDHSSSSNVGGYGYDTGSAVRTAYHLNHNGHLFYQHTESVFLDTDQHKPVPFAYVRTERQSCSRPARVRRTPHYTNMGVTFKVNGVLLPPALCMSPIAKTVAVQTVAVKTKLTGEFCGSNAAISSAYGNAQQCLVVPGDRTRSFFCNYADGEYGACEACMQGDSGGYRRRLQSLSATRLQSAAGPIGGQGSTLGEVHPVGISALAMESFARACPSAMIALAPVVVAVRARPAPVYRAAAAPAYIPLPIVVESVCRISRMWMGFGILIVILACCFCGRDACFPFCGLLQIQMLLRMNPCNREQPLDPFVNVGSCMSITWFIAGILFIIAGNICGSWPLYIAWPLLLLPLIPPCCLPSARPFNDVPEVIFVEKPTPAREFIRAESPPTQRSMVRPLAASPQQFFQPPPSSPANSTVDQAGNTRTML